MKLLFCSECGTKLTPEMEPAEKKEIMFCHKCGTFRFPVFSTAIITAVLNHDSSRVLLLRQYGRHKWNLLAGYVNKGENAEEALRREMWEEMKLTPTRVRFLFSSYFAHTETLMLCYLTHVSQGQYGTPDSTEVDAAGWFSLAEAKDYIIPRGVAQQVTDVLDREMKK